jgi:hypothetical protein
VRANEYFDQLVSRPDHHSSTHLRTQEEVLEELHFSDKSKATTAYDPVMDAARFIVKSGSGSVTGGDQVRHQFPSVNSGNALFFWEARAESYWASDGSVDGVETYKAFQLSNAGNLTLEPRFRFAHVNLPYVARTDVRTYGSVERGPADSVTGQTGEFRILPDTWTRFWMLLDFDNNRLSYWVGDENRPTVAILNAVPYNWSAAYGSGFKFDQFWFEFNTSQSRSSSEEAYFWGRNLVILKDVEDALSIVELGSNGIDADVRPNPPTNVEVVGDR